MQAAHNKVLLVTVLQVIGRSLPLLVELDVSGCSAVRDDALAALLPLAGRLRRLQLKWCK